MTTFTLTLTATFEAEDRQDAFDQFVEWLTEPSHVEDGVAITEDDEDITDGPWTAWAFQDSEGMLYTEENDFTDGSVVVIDSTYPNAVRYAQDLNDREGRARWTVTELDITDRDDIVIAG